MKDDREKVADRETETIDIVEEFPEETGPIVDVEYEHVDREADTLVQQYTFTGGYAPPGYDNVASSGAGYSGDNDIFDELFGEYNTTANNKMPNPESSAGRGGGFSAETKTLYYTPEEFDLQAQYPPSGNNDIPSGNYVPGGSSITFDSYPPNVDMSSDNYIPNDNYIPPDDYTPNNNYIPPDGYTPNDNYVPPDGNGPDSHYIPPEEPPIPSQPESSGQDNINLRKRILLIAAGAVAAIILFFVIGSLTNPFDAQKDSANIYIVQGETAKTMVNFENSASSAEELVLDCGDFGEIKQTLAGEATKPVNMNFNKISSDTQIVAKYGFLNLKKVKINVVVVSPGTISVSNTLTNITDESGNDLSSKKYCLPNTKVKISVKAMNTSGKPFRRSFNLKINNKVVGTANAVWGKDSLSSASLDYEYTFTKQGYYKIEIGSSKINFICSTNDKPPSNGKMLKDNLSGGMGRLKIQNTYNFPVIVTLCESSDPDKALNRIYINAKDSATMSGIKDGSYMIYMKGGTGYSKMAKDILDTSTSYKSYSPMKFTTTSRTYSIWTLKLGVVGGNSNITPIDDNEIPL